MNQARRAPAPSRRSAPGGTPSAAMVFTLGDGQIGARPSIASGGGRLTLSHRRTRATLAGGPGRPYPVGGGPGLPPAVHEAWLALPSCSSAHVRWRGCRRRNLGGTPPRLGALLEVYAQVNASGRQRRLVVCKTVGLAYVGSNPTPATTYNLSSTVMRRDHHRWLEGAVRESARPLR
jgi:hypothetical protein